jgi:two-component system, LytTR family, response regulator
MYTCIIVDDQKEAVDLIRDHVQKISKLSIQLMTTDSIEALTFLDNNKPDIIFLDIEMPDLTGIEFIENIKTKWGNNIPKVVFTTGYSEYALSGYEHGVADYLLKPVTFSRFKMCVDRIIDELNQHNTIPEEKLFFFVEDKGQKVKINFGDIIYIEGAGNYITIVMDESKKMIYKSLSAMHDILPSDKFLRVHKSYIVAISRVHAIKGNNVIVKVKDVTKGIPLGIKYKDNVLKCLGIN